MIDHIVPHSARPMPISRYLARAYPMLPGWAIREALKKRDVKLNGAKVSSGEVLPGDHIEAYIPDAYLTGPIDVIYQGDGLLVVDKPPALPVDVDHDGVGMDTALIRARAVDPNARLCHRLDWGTGGVLMLATDDEAYEKALAAFKNHDIQKTYECVVKGRTPERGVLIHYLAKNADEAFVKAYDRPHPGAELAKLSYRTIKMMGDSSKVEVELITGRTHQIRAQFAKANHPLLGDDKYGSREYNLVHKAVLPRLVCRRIIYLGHEFVSRGGVECT